jgi:hypothetical protein
MGLPAPRLLHVSFGLPALGPVCSLPTGDNSGLKYSQHSTETSRHEANLALIVVLSFSV